MMPTRSTVAASILLAAQSLTACNNTYTPPASEPENWGQQHYIDNQRYQETIDQQQSD